MRRSSRARANQAPLPPAPPAHSNSSTSLNSVARADRNTRSNNVHGSPHESITRRSESIEDSEATGRGEAPTARRSKRSNTNDKEENKALLPEPQDDEEAESEEVTRCICGFAEYPGPHPQVQDVAPKDELAQALDLAAEGVPEDTGNFFIQCDRCKVWQHGGCIGLVDESMSPDEYYCELCKPECHRIHRTSQWPRSSQYLPVLEASSPEPSLASSSRDKSKKSNGKARQREKHLSTMRRATMNSRDAAYDEDEMLRLAIEESRENVALGKRGREGSEEARINPKRRRTSSDSVSPKPALSPTDEHWDDDESRANGNSLNGPKKIRGAAARNHRDKELRDRQKDIAALRAEAASKRNARSERRRADDSNPPSPTLSPSKPPTQSTNNNRLSIPDAPSLSHSSRSNPSRKTGRPPTRRGRLGRNQYTRDPPLPRGSETPLRSRSIDPAGRSSPFTGPSTSNGGAMVNGESGRHSRPKYHHPQRTSMNEMKRRVAGIVEFVGKMVDKSPGPGPTSSRNGSGAQSVAQSAGSSAGPSGQRTPHAGTSVNGVAAGAGVTPTSNATTQLVNGSGGFVQSKTLIEGVEAVLGSGKGKDARADGDVDVDVNVNGDGEADGGADAEAEVEFQDLSSEKMLSSLMSELKGWQSLYGRYGEK